LSGIYSWKEDPSCLHGFLIIALSLPQNLIMPAKPSSKNRTPKKPARGKMSLSRLAMILVAILIALAFILFSVYSPKSKRATTNRPGTSSNKGVEFRKDGTLRIITSGSEIKLDIEVADDEEERMQGLMYRYSMAENQGMLFIFPNEEPRSFWMKNTYIPLDIIYLDSKKEIVSIQKYTQPKSTYSLPSEKAAMYVLEVVAGYTDKYNVKPGDRVEF
jgi:hypothetical protein